MSERGRRMVRAWRAPIREDSPDSLWQTVRARLRLLLHAVLFLFGRSKSINWIGAFAEWHFSAEESDPKPASSEDPVPAPAPAPVPESCESPHVEEVIRSLEKGDADWEFDGEHCLRRNRSGRIDRLFVYHASISEPPALPGVYLYVMPPRGAREVPLRVTPDQGERLELAARQVAATARDAVILRALGAA